MTTHRSANLAAIILLTSAAAQAQTPYRVKDINPIATPAFAGHASPLTRVGHTFFFPADDPVNGRELWRSDGTVSGSGLVKDLAEGPSSSNPLSLTDVEGTLFFATFQTALWKSDGTAEGTTVLMTSPRIGPMASFQGELFFANDGKLWKSDGTVAGTVAVASIRPGTGGDFTNLIVVGGRLFFGANDGVNGTELWVSDGTTDGTVLLKDINPGPNGSFPGPIADVGGTAFFAAQDGATGGELWKSDGTPAGTTRVRDIAPGPASSGPLPGVVFDGAFYFPASTPAAGYELWRSDGTEAGTVMVRDLRPGTEGSIPSGLAVVGGIVYFTARSPIGSLNELWRSDGTESGTVPVREAIGRAMGNNPAVITAGDTVLYYTADDLIWRTDGTAAGTMTVDVNPGPSIALPLGLSTLGDRLFFSATDATGSRLWHTDGTTTVRVDLPVSVLAPSNPGPFKAFGGAAYFSADDGVHGRELWRTDGTEAGTTLLMDTRPGTLGGDPRGFVEFEGSLYFSVSPSQIWRTDGTEEGTTRATPLGVFGGGAVAVPSRSLMFFCASDAAHGSELWRTDGTEAGTALVKDIVPGTGSSSCTSVVDAGGTVFFVYSQLATGAELWRSDGTEAGTTMVKDIVAGALGSNPVNLVNLDGTLLFTASDSAHGTELWRSDGTAEGTVLLKDVRPGPPSTSFPIPSLFVVGDRVYFSPDDGVHGNELWVSDGTADGTHLVKDIVPGTSGGFSGSPVLFGGRVVFIASDGTGLKLWTTDGTEAGTEIVTPLPVLSALSPFALRDTLFFAGRDDAGAEPWRTDGSPVGTGRVADLLPGGRSSSPALFGALGSVLLFSATDDTAGRELWALDLNRPPTAQAGPDQTVEAGTDVVLDGSTSSDPDGDPLTYEWRDSAGAVVATESTATVGGLAPGVHEYSLTVGDGRVTASDTLTVTVLEPASIAIGNALLREGGRRDHRLAVFEVRLARASAHDVSVHYATQDGTARAPRDYVAASGTLHFPAGATSSTVEVTVNGDRRCERDEVFFVVLDGVVNAVLGESRGHARIVNDDCGRNHQ